MFVASVNTYVADDLPEEFGLNSAWDGITEYVDGEWKEGQDIFLFYCFFQGVWVMQFLIYFNYVVVAGAIAAWYFVPLEATSQKKTDLPHNMVTQSCLRAARFHVGSIALGAFIIAVCETIRAIVKYMEENTKNSGNAMAAYIFKCIGCCLTCVECCLDKLNKSAFCWIAAWGGNFCEGACSSFSLLLANIMQTAAMAWVGSSLLFLGKAFVSLFSTGVMCLIIDYCYNIDSLVGPALLIFIIALLVGHIFMVELNVAVDVIFMCYLVDSKAHNGNLKYGTKSLGAIFKSTNAKAPKRNGKDTKFDNVATEDAEMDEKQ